MKTPFQLAPPSARGLPKRPATVPLTGSRNWPRRAAKAPPTLPGSWFFSFGAFPRRTRRRGCWPRATFGAVFLRRGDARQAFDQLGQTLLVAFQRGDFLALGLEPVADRGQVVCRCFLRVEQLGAAFLLLALDLRQLRLPFARRVRQALLSPLATVRNCWIRSALARESWVRKYLSRADWLGSWPESSSFNASESPPTNWRLSTRASWFCCVAGLAIEALALRVELGQSGFGFRRARPEFMQAPVGGRKSPTRFRATGRRRSSWFSSAAAMSRRSASMRPFRSCSSPFLASTLAAKAAERKGPPRKVKRET
jgi:hypothetical protein